MMENTEMCRFRPERMFFLEYFFSPEIFMSGFPVPVAVVDKYIKLAGASQLKVLLFLLRHATSGINPQKAADELGLEIGEVEEAIGFWSQAGLIFSKGEEIPKPAKKIDRPIRPKSTKPTREEVARRGLEDTQVQFLLKEAQATFGRPLKANEASSLVWLHDDEGIPASVIIMVLTYAVAENSCNVSFIEKTALKWIEKGIDNVVDAEAEIQRLQQIRAAWRKVCSAMHIEKRVPSATEEALSSKWVYDYGFGGDVLGAAYDACVDSISKFDMKYTKGILENWHKLGVKTKDDIPNGDEPIIIAPKKSKKGKKTNAMNTTDMDLAEKMLITGGGN